MVGAPRRAEPSCFISEICRLRRQKRLLRKGSLRSKRKRVVTSRLAPLRTGLTASMVLATLSRSVSISRSVIPVYRPRCAAHSWIEFGSSSPRSSGRRMIEGRTPQPVGRMDDGHTPRRAARPTPSLTSAGRCIAERTVYDVRWRGLTDRLLAVRCMSLFPRQGPVDCLRR
jgi:hypothetical protein